MSSTTTISTASGGNLTYGCTDPLALNFDSTAICDSLVYTNMDVWTQMQITMIQQLYLKVVFVTIPVYWFSILKVLKLTLIRWYSMVNDRTGPANAWVRGVIHLLQIQVHIAYDSTYFMYVEGNLSN